MDAAAPAAAAAAAVPAAVEVPCQMDESTSMLEKRLDFAFRHLVPGALRVLAVGAPQQSAPFHVLGVSWRLVVVTTASDHVRISLALTEPGRAVTPGHVHMSFPDLSAYNTSCSARAFSSDPATQSPLVADIPFHAFTTGAGRNPRPTQANGHLTVKLVVKAAEAGGAASAAAFAAPDGSTLMEQMAKLLETKDGADVTVTLGDGAAAADEPLVVHSWLLRQRCGASALLRSNTLAAPPDVGAEAMKALVAFLYTDAPPAGLKHATLRELLVAAAYFDVPLLVVVCQQLLVAALSPRNMLATLKLAHDRLPLLASLRSEALRYVATNVSDAVLLSSDWAALPQEVIADVFMTLRNQGEPPPPKMLRRREEGDAADAGGAPKRIRHGG